MTPRLAGRAAGGPWTGLLGVVSFAAVVSPCVPLAAPTPFRIWPGGEPDLGRDLVLNLVAFVPLGLALRGARPRILLPLLVLLVGVEFLQRHLGRTPAGTDLVLNLTGFLGAVLFPGAARPWPVPARPRARRRLRLAAGLFLVLLLGAVAAAAGRRVPTDLRNWEPMPLHLLDEKGADYPFRGVLHALRIVAGSGRPPLVALGGDREPPWPAWVEGRVSAAGLAGGVRQRAPDPLAEDLVEKLRGGEAVGLELEVTTSSGPGPEERLVCISRGPWTRNLLLAFREREIAFAVRTPLTGDTGKNPELVTRTAPLRPGTRQTVRAFLDDGLLGIDVDGEPVARRFLGSAAHPWPLGETVALWLALMAAAGQLLCRAAAPLGHRLAALLLAALVLVPLMRASYPKTGLFALALLGLGAAWAAARVLDAPNDVSAFDGRGSKT